MYVHYLGREGARPLLLLHGGGVAGWMWKPTISRLDDEFHLIVPDLPGHDRSAEEDYRSHDHTVSDLAALLKRTCSSPATVIGFSLGAQLAILLAARHPALVDRIVVISAQAKPSPAPGLTLALLGASVGLAQHDWFAKLQAKELFVPAELLDDYLRTSAGLSKQTLLAAVGENIRFTIPSRWRAFPGSALILAGSREKLFMRASAESLHNALSRNTCPRNTRPRSTCPRSTWEIVDGAGHGIPLQRTDWLARRLRNWLRD